MERDSKCLYAKVKSANQRRGRRASHGVRKVGVPRPMTAAKSLFEVVQGDVEAGKL